MKVLIVSDTHGRHGNLEAAIEKEKPFDRMIHLGDIERGEDYIRAIVDCEVDMVCGNNDFYVKLPYDKEVEIEGTKLFLTHGHTHFIYSGLERLVKEAKKRGADVVMYGHLHEPELMEMDELTVLSPGSIAYPRQEGRKPSYAIMNVEKGKKAEFEICYLE